MHLLIFAEARSRFVKLGEPVKINKRHANEENNFSCVFVKYDKHTCSGKGVVAVYEYKLESLI